ncbi:hypothetical protein TUM17387_38030 [Shewanella carassii]|nr:hypothetical protein TUM17387_38030 [Shewanella carassii]
MRSFDSAWFDLFISLISETIKEFVTLWSAFTYRMPLYMIPPVVYLKVWSGYAVESEGLVVEGPAIWRGVFLPVIGLMESVSCGRMGWYLARALSALPGLDTAQ